MKGNSIRTETRELKSQKAPPPIKELAAFENDLVELVRNIKFQIRYKVNSTINQDPCTCRKNIKYVQASKGKMQ